LEQDLGKRHRALAWSFVRLPDEWPFIHDMGIDTIGGSGGGLSGPGVSYTDLRFCMA
jgi:hypothetical protein